MKKLIAVTGIILIAYVIFSAAADRHAVVTSKDNGEENNAVVYILREENDRIVVYRNSCVYLKTDTQVSALPKGDRAKLKNGITVYSEKELKCLMEDYCS